MFISTVGSVGAAGSKENKFAKRHTRSEVPLFYA
jgi:hypothetical protein